MNFEVDFFGWRFCSFVLSLILDIFLLYIGAFAAAEVRKVF
jgi:hypothetical protein